MISLKYKKIYDEFIKKYEEIHLNPWHSVSKEETNVIYDKITNMMDVNDEYSFNYFINYILKRISGKIDAHTKLFDINPIPINFRIINDEVLVNSPQEFRGSKLLSINGIDIDIIIKSIDDIITYGTDGKKIYETEIALMNKNLLFGLPELRNSDSLTYEIITLDNKLVSKEFQKVLEHTDENERIYNYSVLLFNEFRYGKNNATYYIEDDTIIYNLSSVQSDFKEKVNMSLNQLKNEDFNIINRIVVNLTGNTGGNSDIVKDLIDFIKKSGKEIIVVIDYRLFSSGRHILYELMQNACIVIGTDISTPMNCFGNNTWINIDGKNFMISEWYFNYNNDNTIPCEIRSKEEYKKYIYDDALNPNFIHPDIFIEQTKDDFINGINTAVEYAINTKFRDIDNHSRLI